MPPQTQKSPLFAKLGKRVLDAHDKSKDIPPPADAGARLPPGIENGVAQLTRAEIKEFQSGEGLVGESFFQAAAVMVSPETVPLKDEQGNVIGEAPVKNKHTRIGPIPLCDTPNRAVKTFEEHWKKMQDILWNLGLKPNQYELAKRTGNVEADVQALMARLKACLVALTKKAPYFSVRTWKGDDEKIEQRQGKFFVVQRDKVKAGPFPTEAALKEKHRFAGRPSQVNEVWGTAVDWSPNGADGLAPGHGVEDSSLPTEEVPADGAPVDETPTSEEMAPGGADFSEFDDIDSLIARAKAKDGTAQDRLKELALAVGIEESAVDDADSWEVVKDMIIAAQSSGEAGEEAPPPAEEWKVNDVCLYSPLDPKTGKPLVDPKTKKPRKPVECMVKKVDKKSEVADLETIDEPKRRWSKVPLDQLNVPS